MEDPDFTGPESDLDAMEIPSAPSTAAELPLNRLKVLEGDRYGEAQDREIYPGGIQLDDNGSPRYDISSHYEIGDRVILHNRRGGDTAAEGEYHTYEYEVMAKVAIGHYTNSFGVGMITLSIFRRNPIFR